MLSDLQFLSVFSMTPDCHDLLNDLISSSTANAKAATIAIAGAPDRYLAIGNFLFIVVGGLPLTRIALIQSKASSQVETSS